MYEEFFNFSAAPFKLNPDPKFFFGSRSHNKAMAYLHYGLRQAEGFIVITGEIGAGKSIMIGHLLDQLDRSNVIAAHLLTPNLKSEDLISHVLSAFRVEPAGEGTTAEIEAFEDFLFDQLNRGRRVLLIVDEAQNLPKETLEELRILSNMDYDGSPLFQVFLVGQPEFRPVLAGAGMEQLRQRIIASYHLQPLNREETQQYIEHRLTVVGWVGEPAFTDEAFVKIFDWTGGVPRKINKLLNRLLLSCSMEQQQSIDGALVDSIVDDIDAEDVGVETDETDITQFEDYPPNLNQHEEESDVFLAELEGSSQSVVDDVLEEGPAMEKADGLESSVDYGEDVRVIVPFAPIAKIESDSSQENQKVQNQSDAVLQKEAVDNSVVEGEVAMLDEVERESADDKPAAGESLLDSLKRQGKVKKKENEIKSAKKLDTSDAESAKQRSEEAQPATIDDVANAIAAIGDAEEEAPAPLGNLEDFDTAFGSGVEVDSMAIGAIPSIDDNVKEWRKSIVKSINETRNELKEAHSNVSRIRRQLADNDRRRTERKNQIMASMARAESLLSEIRSG